MALVWQTFSLQVASRLSRLLHNNRSIASFRGLVKESPMLYYALVFFIIAIIAAILGFSGLAAGAAGIAKILFVVFLVIAIATFAVNLLRGR
jgi:uncharacterized membrane protein YtjA (UPF0391 family)